MLAIGRLRGAPTAHAVREALLVVHRWNLGPEARASLAPALAPWWTSHDDLAKLYHLGHEDLGIPREQLWRSAVEAATPPADLPVDAEQAQSALLIAVADVLGIRDPNRHFLGRHSAPLSPLSHADVRRVLSFWLLADREPVEEECLVGRLSLPIDGALREELPVGVDTERLLRGLASSISLKLDEKRSILDRAPSLSRGRLTTLIQIFEEEQVKFAAMEAKNRGQLRSLACEHGLRWLRLRDERRSARAG